MAKGPATRPGTISGATPEAAWRFLDRIYEGRKPTQTKTFVECVEVCEGDTAIGYAILFSGGWDAWERQK